AVGVWWQQSDEPVSPEPVPTQEEKLTDLATVAGGPSLKAAPALREGELSALEVSRQYQSDRHAANARYQGQRVSLRGQVLQTEEAQGGALLITFHAEDEAQPLRALLQEVAPPAPQAGDELGLDCLNQGLVMEEPLLVDCRRQR